MAHRPVDVDVPLIIVEDTLDGLWQLGAAARSRCQAKTIAITGSGGKTINIKNEIAKVREYWANKEPIPWIQVNSQPGYVHFTHKRHIKRGFECAQCHGDVASMDQVHQVYRMNMGFCISCHTENAKDQEELTHLKDCLTCHY